MVEGDDVEGDVTVSVGAEVAGSTVNVDSTVGRTEEVPTVVEDSEEAEDLPDNTSTPATTLCSQDEACPINRLRTSRLGSFLLLLLVLKQASSIEA